MKVGDPIIVKINEQISDNLEDVLTAIVAAAETTLRRSP